MGPLMQDLKYALRSLRKTPAFMLTAVTALALGIGANTAIFSVVHAVLLRPLSYPESRSLVMVWEDHQRTGGPREEWTNPATFFDWRDQSHVFEFALNGWTPTLMGQGGSPRLVAAQVTQGIFDTLTRVDPMLALRHE